MITLLIIIYIAFIGLGIPDSLFGPAWPAMYVDLNLPVSMGGYITLLISVFTALSSFFSGPVIDRFGTGKVTAISTVLTAFALWGYSVSGNVWLICLFSFPLGLGAGAIDTALNNYVALHYNASQMSFLHCFYGVGVTLSPYLMSTALSLTDRWQTGYRWAFFIQVTIAILTILALPLWKKVAADLTKDVSEEENEKYSFKSLLKKPSVIAVAFIFITTCGVEFICGTWGSTFLVEEKGLPVHMAALVLTLYYFGMTSGRFLSGVLASRMTSWQIIKASYVFIFVAVLMLVLPLGTKASIIALFLIGLGNGPLYPNFMHLTPINFGAGASQTVIGIQIAAAYVGIMTLPTLFGFMAEKISLNIFSYFIIILYFIMVLSFVMLRKCLKNENR